MKTLILSLLISLNAFAISESDFRPVYEAQVQPHFDSFKAGHFQNRQGLRVAFKYKINPQATRSIVVLPGRTESVIKYAELLFDLSSSKTNLFIIDHQGQGLSQRSLKDSQKGYVRDFSFYVDDLEQYMDQVVVPHSKNLDLFLVAHSMGGAIAAHYLARHPQQFTKAVLSAPMMKLNTDPYPEFAARLLSSTLALAGKGANYAPGKGPYKPDEDTFENNTATHSRARFELSRSQLIKFPKQTTAGPTVRWVEQSLKATRRIHLLAPSIHTPILMFQAEKDTYVVNDRQTSFCTLSASCKLLRFPGAYHEILHEKDVIRQKALEQIRKFLKL